MAIESEVFERKRFVFEKLLAYGFTESNDGYYFQTPFFDGEFEAELFVSKTGRLTGKVIDSAFGEEYAPLRVERVGGTYVGQVREAYVAILEAIATACCVDKAFMNDQTNRLASYLATTVGDTFDHPFEKYPSYTSFRVSGKWYALIFPLTLGKLDGVPKELAEQKSEVVNIKVAPEQMTQLLSMDGIYPSYHMSKKTWVSIVLDGSLPDDRLFELVKKSRQLVAPRSLANPNGPDYWIIPANMKDYDIDRAFAANRELYWHQKASIKSGDIVLIYITAPTKAVRYICEVLEDHVEDNGELLMKVRLTSQLSDDQLTFETLKELGVKAVRGPRRVTKSVVDLIHSWHR